MKKVIKALLFVLAALVALVLAALVLHPLWLGPAVKAGAVSAGPRYTGTPIALSDCSINLFSGKIALSGFDLANPPGCGEKSAARVGTLVVDVDAASALGDVVTIRSIEIYDLFASYVKAGSGKYNFTEIADNAQTASSGDGAAQEPAAADEAARPETASEESGKKVIIEKVTLSGLRFNVMGLTVPVPGTIVITDIGKESNGVSWKCAWEEVSRQIVEKTGVAGDALSALGGAGADAAQKGFELGKEGLAKALETAESGDLKSAEKTLKATGKKLENIGKQFKGLLK